MTSGCALRRGPLPPPFGLWPVYNRDSEQRGLRIRMDRLWLGSGHGAVPRAGEQRDENLVTCQYIIHSNRLRQ